MIDKKQMTEEEIKLNFITPAIERTWPKNCIRMEFPITKGRIMIDGKKPSVGKHTLPITFYVTRMPA